VTNESSLTIQTNLKMHKTYDDETN